MLLNPRKMQRVINNEWSKVSKLTAISGRLNAERDIERANQELQTLAIELERSMKGRSEFLARMSHELRTPLNSINGFSEVLFDETFGPLNGKQRKYVGNVLASGKELLLLIDQIIDIATMKTIVVNAENSRTLPDIVNAESMPGKASTNRQ